MNHRMRRTVETLACERRYNLADLKGAEYSGAGSTYTETGADTLNNFKSVAERIGGTPEQVLMTYLLKHVDSINTTVREAAAQQQGGSLHDNPGPVVYAAGEGIVSRLDDARNYLDLLECVLIDNGHIAAPGQEWDDPSIPTDEQYQLMEQYKHENDDDISEEGFAGPPLEIKTERTAYDAETDRMLKEAGLTEGLDGVWRGATKVDESVAPNALKETPICGPPVTAQPWTDKDPVAAARGIDVPAQPTMDKVRSEPETGEL